MNQELSYKLNKLYNQNEFFKDFNGYIMVKEDTEILFEQNFGYSDYQTKQIAHENTVYNIGSITKQFTALCTLQLVQKGLIDLDNCIGSYLPDFKNGANVKIRDMLNMVSGMPEYWWRPGWKETDTTTSEDAYEFIKTLTDYKPPHQSFDYCNSNYIVLGKLIERISGLSLSEYMESNIFRPLGLQHTYFQTANGHTPNLATGYKSPRVSKWEKATAIYSFAGAGGVCSSAADLCIWDNALYTDRLLRNDLMEVMFQPVLSGYAMGWYIDGANASHGGDTPGFSTSLTRVRDRKLLILLLCNFDGCKESNMSHYAGFVKELVLK